MGSMVDLLDTSDFVLEDDATDDLLYDDNDNFDSEATMTYQAFEKRIILREKEVEEARRDCVICLEEITERGVIDSCTHSFCYECISMWGKKQKKCPCCKRTFRRIRKAKKTPKKTIKTKTTKKKTKAVEGNGQQDIIDLLDDNDEKENNHGDGDSKYAIYNNSDWNSRPPKKATAGRGRKKPRKDRQTRPSRQRSSTTAANKEFSEHSGTQPTVASTKNGNSRQQVRAGARTSSDEPATKSKSRKKVRNGVIWIQSSLTGKWTRGRRAGSVDVDIDLADPVSTPAVPDKRATLEQTPNNDDSNCSSAVSETIASCSDTINAMRQMMQQRARSTVAVSESPSPTSFAFRADDADSTDGEEEP